MCSAVSLLTGVLDLCPCWRSVHVRIVLESLLREREKQQRWAVGVGNNSDGRLSFAVVLLLLIIRYSAQRHPDFAQWLSRLEQGRKGTPLRKAINTSVLEFWEISLSSLAIHLFLCLMYCKALNLRFSLYFIFKGKQLPGHQGPCEQSAPWTCVPVLQRRTHICSLSPSAPGKQICLIAAPSRNSGFDSFV